MNGERFDPKEHKKNFLSIKKNYIFKNIWIQEILQI